MKKTQENEKHLPAYVALYQKLREEIVRGVYTHGSKLPSKRVTAAEEGVSVITVEHAYALLADEGYVEARERSGYFVTFREGDGFLSSAMRTAPAHPQIKKALPASEEACSFPLLARTMRRVLSVYGEELLEKSPGRGCLFLRRELARYLSRSRGIDTHPDGIVIGSGSEYLYGLVIRLLGRQRGYAIESPSYRMIEQVYRSFEVVPEKLPLGHDGIESDALWQTNAAVLHLTPYRSFPSGVSASASKRHEYLRWADRDGRYLVEDDFESEFSVSRKHEETLFSHTRRENVIYLNTFSKTISPSMRVGYMVLPPSLAERFEQELGFYSCTVPTFEQYVLGELIAAGDFERHINRVRRQKRRAAK
ncbi:MAG: PLP-dependent aminotransferase family protein [Ruminococcaceae bacterium]|nr:PLP-dependent aminotransferase family protein [Oscillospiraceae bacterium]